MISTLIVPGLNGSGAGHWQRWFQGLVPEAVWVEQTRWDAPDLDVWSARLVDEIDRAKGRVLLVAHSFGCLTAVASAMRRRDRVAGALLVAPADPRKFGVSKRLSTGPLGFPSVVVASTSDPWVSITTARYWAGRWASRFVNVGDQGHINIDAGFGPWPEGFALYQALFASVTRPSAGCMRRFGDAPPSPVAEAICAGPYRVW